MTFVFTECGRSTVDQSCTWENWTLESFYLIVDGVETALCEWITWTPHHNLVCIHLAAHIDWLLFNRSSKAFVECWSSKTDFMKILLIYRFSRMLFEKRSVFFFRLKSINNKLTRRSRSGKHGRLGHLIGTREMSHSRSLRSIHFICFLTWVTVGNSSKCVFVLISMLDRVRNSHYSSCLLSKGRTEACLPDK